MKAFVAVMALAGASATPAADPALFYTGIHPAVGGVVAPVVGAVDTGLKLHPASGAVTPDFTDAQKEAAPELAANQKDIKHLAYTGHVVQPTVLHTGAYLYGKREAEAEPGAEADPALLYTTGVHHVAAVAPVVAAPAVYTHGGLVAHPDGAVTPDYTPAQKIAAATHLAAKGVAPLLHTGAYLYGKRDAEAKSDAWGIGYGYPTIYAGAYGYPYGHYGKRDAEAKSDAWGIGYGYPYAGTYGYPYVHYGKRDAEAKSDAWGIGYSYPTIYAGTYGYPYGHYGKRDAEAKSDAWGYGLGLPTVYTGYPYGGVYHYGKRDAEPKSDAWGYGLGLPTVYTGYPYGGVYHYGKRDAEAKSDAWGFGLPVYTGYPYAYGGVYGYGK